jgi:hypothetical protein
MRWLLALILLGAVVVGCKSQAPTADPFFGRTTIPPPPTGSVGGRPADPYYGNATPQTPAATCPPAVQMPGPASTASPVPTYQPNLGTNPPAATPTPTYQPNSGTPAPAIGPTPAYQPPATGTTPTTSPPGFSPSYSAPRPPSTAPPTGVTPPANTPPVPATNGGSPYSPPGGSFDYRGSSRTTIPPASTQTDPRLQAYASPGTTARLTGMTDDRLPRPIDDSAGAVANSRQTIIRTTLPPRWQADVEPRPVDITDLPAVPQ